METITSVLSGVGGLLLGSLAIGMWYGGGNKTAAIWIGFVGVVCFALVGAIQLQDYVWKVGAPKQPDKPQAKNPDRAWIAIGAQLTTGLNYDGKDWRVGVVFELRNAGRSAANSVDLIPKMVPFIISVFPADTPVKDGIPQGKPLPGTDSKALLKEMCDIAVLTHPHNGDFMGIVVPPNDNIVRVPFNIHIDPTSLQAAQQNPGYVRGGNLLLLVCVTYRSPGDDNIHQTGEAFAIYTPDDNIDLRSGKPIPANNLRIAGQPMGGSFAH